jgi:flagellin-like protein
MTADARGQSNVVGVALLLAVAVVALAGLTAGIGALVQHTAGTADAARVADELSTALDPAETTGYRRGEVSFTAGRLRTVERQVRILNSSGVVRTVSVGGLVFEHDDRRVAYVADAVVRSTTESAWLAEPPPLTGTAGESVLVASVARLNASDVAVSGASGTTVALSTRVTHHRSALGSDRFAVAYETATPEPFARWFRAANATVTRRDFDGDGLVSVVGRFPGERVGHLVVHDLDLAVGDG